MSGGGAANAKHITNHNGLYICVRYWAELPPAPLFLRMFLSRLILDVIVPITGCIWFAAIFGSRIACQYNAHSENNCHFATVQVFKKIQLTDIFLAFWILGHKMKVNKI